MRGTEEQAPPSAARRDEMIEALASRIDALGLSTPAILMLEAHKPLSFLGSQALLLMQPLLSLVFDPTASQTYAALLEEGENVELLIRRLERQENNRA